MLSSFDCFQISVVSVYNKRANGIYIFKLSIYMYFKEPTRKHVLYVYKIKL